MNKPAWLTVLRDTVLFALGVLIIAKQAGIFLDPPPNVSIELLVTGAVMANVPGALHVLAWRFGIRTGLPSSPQDALPPDSRSASLPAPYSGGDS